MHRENQRTAHAPPNGITLSLACVRVGACVLSVHMLYGCVCVCMQWCLEGNMNRLTYRCRIHVCVCVGTCGPQKQRQAAHNRQHIWDSRQFRNTRSGRARRERAAGDVMHNPPHLTPHAQARARQARTHEGKLGGGNPPRAGRHVHRQAHNAPARPFARAMRLLQEERSWLHGTWETAQRTPARCDRNNTARTPGTHPPALRCAWPSCRQVQTQLAVRSKASEEGQSQCGASRAFLAFLQQVRGRNLPQFKVQPEISESESESVSARRSS